MTLTLPLNESMQDTRFLCVCHAVKASQKYAINNPYKSTGIKLGGDLGEIVDLGAEISP